MTTHPKLQVPRSLLANCVLVLGVVSLFFFLRLWGLSQVSLFTDEAIYVRWMQIGAQDPKERFIPLTDGKPPLYHWIGMGAVLLPLDPVFAARLISVMAGLLSLVVVVFIAKELKLPRSVMFWLSLAMTVHPMMVVYDRLAVVDSLLTSLTLVTLWLLLRLRHDPRAELAIVTGLAWGLALLTKTSALLTIGLAPLIAAFENKSSKWTRLRYVGLVLVVVVVGQLMYQSLRVSPLFFRIEQKNAEFVLPVATVLADPFALTYGNLKSLIAWFVGYSTIPLMLAAILGLLHRDRRFSLAIWLFVIAQLVLMASFNKIIFARYLLTLAPLLLLVAGLGVDWIRQRHRYGMVAAFVVLIWPLVASLSWVMTNGPTMIPMADASQYRNSWTVAHGLKDIVSFLENESQAGPLLVGTQGTFGLMPYGLEIYLADNPNIRIESFWPVDTVPTAILERASLQPTYFVYNEIEEVPANQPITLIMEFPREDSSNTMYLRLYRVEATDPE